MSNGENGASPTGSGSDGRVGFGTKIGFVMAAAGSAVGLGNLARFPSQAQMHGGGAFVLIYLGAVLLVGFPLMYSELVIGRRGKGGALNAIRAVTAGKPAGGVAAYGAGIMAVVACVLMLSFYSVIAGWGIHFLTASIGGVSDYTPATEFKKLLGDSPMQVVWHSVFMFLTIGVVIFGVQKGIERVCNVMMPMLLLFMIGLIVYVGVQGWLGDSLTRIFVPDWSKVSEETVLAALGQAFFSLSLGMGTMILYGSYMRSDDGLVRDGAAVVGLDTLVALMGGIVVFAVIAAYNQTPTDSTAGVLFETMPPLFTRMPGGSVLGVVFFILVLFAAWSSAISLLEVPVAFLIANAKMPRWLACMVAGLVIWGLGFGSAWNGNVLDSLDGFVSNVLFPTGGLIVAIVAGWMMTSTDRQSGFTSMGGSGNLLGLGWLCLIRYVTPVLVIIVMGFGLYAWIPKFIDQMQAVLKG